MKYIIITALVLMTLSASGIDMKNNISSCGLENWEIEPHDKPVLKPNEVKTVKAGNNNLIMIHLEKPTKTAFCRLKYNTCIIVAP